MEAPCESRIFLIVALAGRRRGVRRSRGCSAANTCSSPGYVVLQFVVLATAWNILGGYCGYVNFGSAAFFALGAYTTVFFNKTYPLPIPVADPARRRHRPALSGSAWAT